MNSQTTIDWLKERPKWLQVAARRLLEFGELDEDSICDLAKLCQQETNDEFPNIDYNIPGTTFNTYDLEEIRLQSISEIVGVNKLAPKKPLDFGSSNIAVIYGNNGSGKSGYVRLLKHICGARDRIRGQLYKNVFSDEDVDQKAKIVFLRLNTPVEYEWTGQGVCEELCAIDIFDSSFNRIFMGSDDEVSYEPPVLSFFSKLIDVCEKVSMKLDGDTKTLQSKLPHIPPTLNGSTGADWIENLSYETSNNEIGTYCSFSSSDEEALQEIQKRITEQNPAGKAKQLAIKKNHADTIINDVQDYMNQLSDDNCKQIIETKKQYILKKLAADTAAKDAFSGLELEGVGSDVWKELWNAARNYSKELAYFGQEFPVVGDDSVCVLCHQPLSAEAKQRLISFESYIKGETQKQAILAEKEWKKVIENLTDILSEEALRTKIDAAGINNQDIIKSLTDTVASLKDRKEKIQLLDSEDALTSIDQAPVWIVEIQRISQEYQESAEEYQKDAAKDNQEKLPQKLKDLQAKKWLTENKDSIQEEINRLKALEQIKNAKKKTSSIALSKKKGELADALITDAFVQRFNKELTSLGASRIKVKLIKSKVSKGKVLHTLQLDGATRNNLNDVLSEGENRIVSIAAFLADVTGRNFPSPFVFDDPISSLDQDYEEAIVQRLCSIALERQIIIFTHRLSLLGLVQDYAKKAEIEPEIICIREEAWGTGEPGETPLFVKKPEKALNQLISDRIPKAKKLLSENGKEAYEPYAKALCSDFRIILERMIECELMGDIVQRYRRAINTMGKINSLAKILESDCTYFDKLMTKYSRFEHSQPLEAPVPLPEPDELESDFDGLKQWHEEFKARKKQ